jgi:hypothetical protein
VAVQTADVVAGTTIYYVPYIHDQLPVVGLTLGTGVSLALAAGSQLSGKLYDLFLFNNSGTLVLGTGAAWTSLVARSQAIGQTTVPGIWTNTATVILTYNATPSTVSATAGTALYVGTMYASANGQCTCQFNPAAAAGGSNTQMLLYNAYNRVRNESISREPNPATWDYSSTTWRPADNSTSNRISFIDGLGQSIVFARYTSWFYTISAATQGSTGINLDASTGQPAVTVTFYSDDGAGHGVSAGPSTVFEAFAPGIGFHYVQAMESVDDGGTMEWDSNTNGAICLGANLEY